MNNVAILSLEILVAGITATVWIVLLIVKILIPDSQVEKIFASIYNSLSLGNLLIFSILIYNLGWIVHHIGERLLEPVFQTKWRKKYFTDSEFYRIRTIVFQKASKSTIDDIKFDRHILRISRCNILNFTIILIVSIFYLSVNKIISILGMCASIIIVTVSFLQWKSRCEGTFKKFKDIYNIIELDGCKEETIIIKTRKKKSRKNKLYV